MHRREFHEFEEYAESVGDADLRITLAKIEHPYWSLQQFSAGSLHIQCGSDGAGSIVEGAAHHDSWGLFAETRGICRANGKHLHRDSIFVIPPQTEFVLTSEASHSWFSIRIPATMLPSRCRCAARVEHAHPLSPGTPVTGELCVLVADLVQTATTNPAALKEPASQSVVEDTLLRVTRRILGLQEACETPDCRTCRRRDLVAKAVEVIEDCPEMAPTMSELVAATGVAERTLRAAFVDFFGLSPRRYMQLRRLHQARHILQKGGRDAASVSEVATRLGFWDYGRFAGRYRRLFGEPPSETLRRRRRS